VKAVWQEVIKMSNWTRSKTLWITRTAILTAIMLILLIIPQIGYPTVGPISITIMMIPVAVGAIMVGPACGLFLGFIFGVTSLIRCFTGDVFGAALFGLNPAYTVILCFIPRILMGWLVGIIFQALHRIDKTRMVSFVVASLSAAALNTIFFMSGLILLFWNTEFLRNLGKGTIIGLLSLVVVNVIVELAVCMIIGTAITKALSKVVEKRVPAAVSK
jgi:uncharacterized membrane protein